MAERARGGHLHRVGRTQRTLYKRRRTARDTRRTTVQQKRSIVVIADRSARIDPTGHLFRFIRDHARVLRDFALHCTEQTGKTILGTGLYEPSDISQHKSEFEARGDELLLAALVELIAMVARREYIAAIFFSNPGISRVDLVEYRALKRVCIESKVRWLSSLESAENWAQFQNS